MIRQMPWVPAVVDDQHRARGVSYRGWRTGPKDSCDEDHPGEGTSGEGMGAPRGLARGYPGVIVAEGLIRAAGATGQGPPRGPYRHERVRMGVLPVPCRR